MAQHTLNSSSINELRKIGKDALVPMILVNVLMVVMTIALSAALIVFYLLGLFFF